MKLFSAAAAFFLFSALLIAQDAAPAITTSVPDSLSDEIRNAPAWLLRDQGRAARLDRDFSDAFLLLTRSLEKDPNNPETLTELALTYAAVQDFFQARENLNLALDNRSRLSSPDLEYFILYQLADIYRNSDESQDSTLQYERILNEIVSHDTSFSSQDDFDVNLRKNIRQVFLSADRSGTSLDRMVTLYRLDDSFSLWAHILLGEFYVHSGRYNDALDHLIFAVLKMYSLVIEKIREDDPLFAFSSSEDFFSLVAGNEDWIAYLKDSGFDEAMYYLGAAAYSEQATAAVYRGVWNTLRMIPYDSVYKNRASVQLRNPHDEEILYGSQQFRDEVNNR